MGARLALPLRLSAAVVERIVHANGIDLCVEESGAPEAPPLLLIAGLGVQMLVFHDGLCEALAARGFRVVRYDQRDVGRSTRFDDACPDPVVLLHRALRGEPFDAPYRLEDLADDAAGLIEALGLGSAHVFGASLGGSVGLLLAARHPERVRRLVAMMTRATPTTPRAEDLAYYVGPPETTRASWIEADVEGWRAMRGGGFAFDEAGTREMSARSLDRSFDERGPARPLLALLAAGDRRPLLSSVAAPTLVLHGDADPIVPLEAGRDVAALVPGARFEAIPGLGHELPSAAWPVIVDHVARHLLGGR